MRAICINISFGCHCDDFSRLPTRETSIICLILFMMIVFLSEKDTLLAMNQCRIPLKSIDTCIARFLSGSF